MNITKLINPIHHPFIDDDHSLWGINGSALERSVDYGDTWQTVFDFTSIGGGSARTPIYGMTYITRSGYVFVSLEDGKVYRSKTPRMLYKKPSLSFEVVLELSTTSSSLTPWTFAEDNDGETLYIGEYGNLEDELGEWINVAYIYKSNQSGAVNTWQRIDYFIDTAKARKHIHLCMVDPYTNILYITFGDIYKASYRSHDKGQTWEFLIGPPNYEKGYPNGGDTGLSFFPDSRIWGTDWFTTPESTKVNLIRKTSGDDTSFVTKKTYDATPYNNPCFDLHAWNENTAFILWRDERKDLLEYCSSIWKTNDRGETWTLFAETPVATLQPTFIGIAHGRNNMIPPDFPYLIVVTEYPPRTRVYGQEGELYMMRYQIGELPLLKTKKMAMVRYKGSIRSVEKTLIKKHGVVTDVKKIYAKQ